MENLTEEELRDKALYDEAVILIKNKDYEGAAKKLNLVYSVDFREYVTNNKYPDARKLAPHFKKNLFGKWSYKEW